MSRDFDKAQEMVWASMEYVKVLGFRLRRTEVQRDDWKKVAQSHADELIKCRQQIDALKKERDGFFVQIQDMRAELDRLLAQLREEKQHGDKLWSELHELRKLRARAHPVKVGEYVKNDNGDVCQVHEVYAEYLLNTGWTWAFENCTPCDPPEPAVEASHDTPEGLKTAEGAVMPKPGDVVRLVRVPTLKEYPHDSGCWEPNWGGIDDHMRVHYVGSNITGTRVVRAVFGLEWPVSCVEVVKGGKS